LHQNLNNMKPIYLVLCLLGYVASAQQAKEPGSYVWFDAHLQSGNNFVADAALNAEIAPSTVLTLEAQGIIDGILFPRPDELASVNLLAGRIIKSEIAYIMVSGGLGIGQFSYYELSGYSTNIFGTPQEEYTRQTKIIAGIPLEVKAGMAAKVIALQIKAGVNLNPEITTFHIGLGVGFGKLF
jgi:hypothetical protein